MTDQIARRDFVAAAGAIGLAAFQPLRWTTLELEGPMYGLIGKMTTVPGQRDAMITLLLEGTGGMPGCRSYVIAKDTTDVDGIWITEVWDTKEQHDASLSLPAVQATIARAKPLIAGFGSGVVTEPVGGHGLTSNGAK